jgi:hypothetical protein
MRSAMHDTFTNLHEVGQGRDGPPPPYAKDE